MEKKNVLNPRILNRNQKSRKKKRFQRRKNLVHQPIYHLHFGEFMKNWNHQQSFWSYTWNIITCRQISSNEELQPWNFQRKSMNDMIWLQNNVKRARRQRLHHRELRFQELGTKFLVNLLSLIMEEFHCQPIENFSSSWSLMAQHLWLLHTLFRQLPMLKRSSFLWNILRHINWIQNT